MNQIRDFSVLSMSEKTGRFFASGDRPESGKEKACVLTDGKEMAETQSGEWV